MLDFNFSEWAVVALVALVVIGPKDLPKAMRVLGYWVGRARSVARQFRAGFDEMIREAELAEMEKKWKEENERIMRMHPPTPPETIEHAPTPADDEDGPPVMVEKPVVAPAPETSPTDADTAAVEKPAP
ncbi:twin-arginine translocase subunit TatB [Sphingomonas sp. CL5.1]|uniref:Sec-independent protein translocase protein TatB n=1 Tax=Sphingomonas sp. CL5.1 TaxID=2653203 RepID=UPI001581437C|nr:Sec-independent protein translocase protein TatB [Sphingomonas sp. CL5.1]QKS01231.1 twin-arginine translocase subunit TatB [Sphingomonas sp. CL5.1]